MAEAGSSSSIRRCGSSSHRRQAQLLAILAITLPQALILRRGTRLLLAGWAQGPGIGSAFLQQAFALQLAQGPSDHGPPQRDQHAARRGIMCISVLHCMAMNVLQHLLRGETAPVAAVLPLAPEQAALRRQRDGDEDDGRGRHDDQRAGGQALLQAAEDSAAGAGNAAEDAREGQHLPQLLRPLARSHRRRNQQADHENHAGQLQAEHDGDHD